MDEKLQLIIQDKLEFRGKLAEQISITRLDYMFRVLKEMYGSKTSISDPDSFKDKVVALERRQRKLLKRVNSATSAMTSFMSSNTQSRISSMDDSKVGGDSLKDSEDDELNNSNNDNIMQQNPILSKLNNVFESMTSDIQHNGDTRVNFLLNKIKNKPGMNMIDFYKHQETLKSQFVKP